MSLYGRYRGRAAFDAEIVERPEKSPMVRAKDRGADRRTDRAGRRTATS